MTSCCLGLQRTCLSSTIASDASDSDDESELYTGTPHAASTSTVKPPGPADLHLLLSSSMSRLAAGLNLKCEQNGGGVLGMFGGLGVPAVLRAAGLFANLSLQLATSHFCKVVCV